MLITLVFLSQCSSIEWLLCKSLLEFSVFVSFVLSTWVITFDPGVTKSLVWESTTSVYSDIKPVLTIALHLYKKK